jgi:hypothetical protein
VAEAGEAYPGEPELKVRTTLLATGKNTTGIELTPEELAALGGGKKPAVQVTLDGFSYRTSVGSMGGKFLIPVSADRRAAAGVAAGDPIDVEIELDTTPRKVDVPSDLAEALAKDEAARTAFEGLSFSNQQRHVLPIEDAKTPETRQRRIDKTIESLKAVR